MKSLAHPARVLIVHALQHGDKCVSELNQLIDINQSNISRHLAVLKKCGILSDRRDGMKVFYHLQTHGILKAFDLAADIVRTDTKRRADAAKTI